MYLRQIINEMLPQINEQGLENLFVVDLSPRYCRDHGIARFMISEETGDNKSPALVHVSLLRFLQAGNQLGERRWFT